MALLPILVIVPYTISTDTGKYMVQDKFYESEIKYIIINLKKNVFIFLKFIYTYFKLFNYPSP